MEELREQLATLINNAQLPFEAKFYVLKDVYREVYDVYSNMLEQQKLAKQQEEENESAKDEAEQAE